MSRYAFEDYDDDEEGETNDREEEDVVTPYSICNQTNVKLLVKRLSSISNEKKTNANSDKKNRKKAKDYGSNGLTVKGGVGSNLSKLNRVYVINPD